MENATPPTPKGWVSVAKITMNPFKDEENVQPGMFNSWREFLKAVIVFAICSGAWSGLIVIGTRLWHK